MSTIRNSFDAQAPGEFTVLDLDDTRYPPVFALTDPPEERFRNTPAEIIREYLEADILDDESRAAAIAELARRGGGT